MYDLDKWSTTYGYGDRLYWGWKISDFPNGTYQGAVHALAIAVEMKLVSNEKFALNVIESAIFAIKNIKSSNGSLSESYPQENSFCVTALVAFDVLSAIKILDKRISADKRYEYIEIIRPLIKFISKHDENHAIISNHLATAVASLALWSEFTGEDNLRYKELLSIIYKHQSKEGWYKEYDGADPGYQTLCTYYLASAYDITKDPELKKSIELSASFLKDFIHPDGTIGGLYGSRNTEVYYPSGIVYMAYLNDDFALINKILSKGQHVTPDIIDANNFIPLVNSYGVASLLIHKNGEVPSSISQPIFESIVEKNYSDAGIFIKSTEKYHLILNYKKGGVIKLFDRDTMKLVIEDGGLFGRLKNGKRISTQQFDGEATFSENSINGSFYYINSSVPGPFTTIVIRILSLSVFKSVMIGDIFKKIIVKMLMTNKKKLDGGVKRIFIFSNERIIVKEHITLPNGILLLEHVGKSKAIHMASSGYYLPQVEQMVENNIIEWLTE